MLLINRELSWLEFNARVLQEAEDARNPLLERLKFAAIFSTNLDEFYMVRVAGLRRQVAAGVVQPPPDGLSAQEQLDAIRARVLDLVARQRHVLHDLLLPALAQQGVRLLRPEDLGSEDRALVDDIFVSQVFPVLTPLAHDPGHPFPYISNLSLSLAVEVRDPERGTIHFARVKVPKSLPRWIPLGNAHHFVPLEQVIGANLHTLFPGMEIMGWHTFRVTRYSDLELPTTEEADDLLAMIEEQVFLRRFAEVVRLEVQDTMPARLRDLLLEELAEEALRDEEGLHAPPGEKDVHETGPLLELGDLLTLATLDMPEHRDPPFVPCIPEDLKAPERSIFDVIRQRDLLVHHPFDSFDATVGRFLADAADDEHVLAIKMTLYRTSGDTAIVRALTDAARAGKQVAVLVELKARFEEANNISWARTLEGVGVHVAYGLPSLKTHAKVALVVRRDLDGIRRYVHIGTGNYNSRTARVYTDLGFFTCAPEIGADVSDFFNMLTGISRHRQYRKLLVGPANMRDRLIYLIDREAAHAGEGRPARIVAKMNALVDAETIHALCRASQAGVDIDLVVRGICCLRPGLPGVSERVRVMSIVGRFLEHSRLFSFANGGNPEYYLGSPDWMPRNFDHRVEAVAPVEDAGLQTRLHALLETCLEDNRNAWDLHGDGTWHQRVPHGTEHAAHRILLQDSWGVSRPPLAEAHTGGNGNGMADTLPRAVLLDPQLTV